MTFVTGKTVAEADPALRRIERYSLIVCVALTVAAGLVTRRADAPLGVLGGGALVAISYRGIKGGISAVVDSRASRNPRDSRDSRNALGLVKFFTRYAILAFAAYVIMARLRL